MVITKNAFNPVMSPAAAVVEDVVGGWLKELLGLPPDRAVVGAEPVIGRQRCRVSEEIVQ